MAKKPDDKSKGKETKEGKSGTDPSAGKQAGSGGRQGKPSDERSAGKKAPRSS